MRLGAGMKETQHKMSLLPALSWEEVSKHLTREGNAITIILQRN